MLNCWQERIKRWKDFACAAERKSEERKEISEIPLRKQIRIYLSDGVLIYRVKSPVRVERCSRGVLIRLPTWWRWSQIRYLYLIHFKEERRTSNFSPIDNPHCFDNAGERTRWSHRNVTSIVSWFQALNGPLAPSRTTTSSASARTTTSSAAASTTGELGVIHVRLPGKLTNRPAVGANSWYPRHHRGYRHQWENNMKLPSIQSSKIMMLPKDGEPIGNNDGVWKWFSSTFFWWRLIL
jgi:hypothetical protein